MFGMRDLEGKEGWENFCDPIFKQLMNWDYNIPTYMRCMIIEEEISIKNFQFHFSEFLKFLSTKFSLPPFSLTSPHTEQNWFCNWGFEWKITFKSIGTIITNYMLYRKLIGEFEGYFCYKKIEDISDLLSIKSS